MNPLKEARTRAGLTQKSLATNLEMTPHAILRYEQGLYDALSPKLSTFIAEQLSESPAAVEKQYHDFQLERRQQSAPYFDPFPSLVMSPTQHPFVFFRNAITERAVGKSSRIGFCILLAMNPAVVLQYEKGRTLHLPLLMASGLKDCSVSEDRIKDLDAYGEIWHERYGLDD